MLGTKAKPQVRHGLGDAFDDVVSVYTSSMNYSFRCFNARQGLCLVSCCEDHSTRTGERGRWIRKHLKNDQLGTLYRVLEYTIPGMSTAVD